MVLKDPEKSDDYLVRRLAAIEGYEMISTDKKEEPFVLEQNQCWVLADNESLKPKVYAFLAFTLFENLNMFDLSIFLVQPLGDLHTFSTKFFYFIDFDLQNQIMKVKCTMFRAYTK